jgi:hypothetical protein
MNKKRQYVVRTSRGEFLLTRDNYPSDIPEADVKELFSQIP